VASFILKRPKFTGAGMSITVAAATLTFGLVVGMISLAGVTSTSSTEGALFTNKEGFELFFAISARNLSVCCLLFSGVVTFGISTAMTSMMLGAYLGATSAASAANVGISGTLLDVIPYAPFEFAGILLSAAAGLLPITNRIRNSLGRQNLLSQQFSYSEDLTQSLRLMLPVSALILLGALMETMSISLHASS
jgi:uncharacterized membrane protein SpoIIM required for sporulation